MPEMIPYALLLRGGLRLGTRGVNLEEAGITVPSDTLHAALIQAWRRCGGSPQEWAEPFLREPPDPPFLLTSAFPYAGEVRFYPLPARLGYLFQPQTIRQRAKELKRIRFFSEALLLRALEGEKLDAWLFPPGESDPQARGAALQGGSLWLSAEEAAGLPENLRPARPLHTLRAQAVWARQRVPHVNIDRLRSASTIFHSGRLAFSPGCGLWFGVQWRKREAALSGGERVEQAFEKALRLLQDDGLGGERSSGLGGFSVQAKPAIRLPDCSSGSLAYLLSRYHPRPDELPEALAWAGTAYQVTAVSGWIQSPDGPAQRRKRLNLVCEGGLVHLANEPAGDMVDVRPDYANPAGDLPHPVYRCGLAVAAGWKAKEASDA